MNLFKVLKGAEAIKSQSSFFEFRKMKNRWCYLSRIFIQKKLTFLIALFPGYDM